MTIDKDNFSTKPGVYLMKDKNQKVLYIGKAKNIKKRLLQYFSKSFDNRPQIPYLMAKVVEIDTIVVSSEKEALLLENTLIKKHQPKYNILLKDDKTYICLQLTKHNWPALKLVRIKGKPKDEGSYFGPYTSAYNARQTFDLLQRLFPLRECSDRELSNRVRPCILYQIKRCIAPCCNKCSKEEYASYVNKVKQFLKGNEETIIKDLKKEMKTSSEKLEFEKAASILKSIKALEEIIEKQRVVSFSNKNRDVVAIYTEKESAAITHLTIQKGLLTNSKTYTFSNFLQDDDEAIKSFLLQFYASKKPPNEILVSIPLNDVDELQELLSKEKKTKLLFPKKGEKIALIKLALENAEVNLKSESQKQSILEKTLLKLQESLDLLNFPEKIECFDNSHISQTSLVSAMVTFVFGKRDKAKTRKYHLKESKGDDISSMKEALTRRYKRAKLEKDLPDLLIVDGGKPQLNLAQKVLSDLNIASVDIIALAKEHSRHDKGLTKEKVYTCHKKEPFHFKATSKELFLLQSIRDEVHKVVLAFHKKTRKHQTIKSSLNEIAGIGPEKLKSLIKHFKSPLAVSKASKEELSKVPLISQTDIKNIIKYFGS